MRKQELQDAENEEEVKLRCDEYRSHALFSRLELYTEELKDFIEEKRKKQLEQQQLREQEKRELLQSSSAAATSYMGAASSILASYADVMRGGGNIFCTQKIFTNNSNFRATATVNANNSAPALSTVSPIKQQESGGVTAAANLTAEPKKREEGAAAEDNEENNEGEDAENEEKENKLAA